MQQSRRPVTSRSSNSSLFGSTLMILLVIAIVVVAGIFIFRATRASSTAKSASRVATVTPHNRAHRAAKRTIRVAPTSTSAQLAQQLAIRQRKTYAAHIVPLLDRSARVFDTAAHAAASAGGNFGSLQQLCSYWGGKVEANQQAYEGVPHPYVWWSPVGTLHHRVSGIFHYMLGAIQNCQEAVQATDSPLSDQATSQMASAAQQLHDVENYSRFLATH